MICSTKEKYNLWMDWPRVSVVVGVNFNLNFKPENVLKPKLHKDQASRSTFYPAFRWARTHPKGWFPKPFISKWSKLPIPPDKRRQETWGWVWVEGKMTWIRRRRCHMGAQCTCKRICPSRAGRLFAYCWKAHCQTLPISPLLFEFIDIE